MISTTHLLALISTDFVCANWLNKMCTKLMASIDDNRNEKGKIKKKIKLTPELRDYIRYLYRVESAKVSWIKKRQWTPSKIAKEFGITISQAEYIAYDEAGRKFQIDRRTGKDRRKSGRK